MRASPAPPRLLIFGAGGSGREVAWLAEQALPGARLAFVVDRPEYLGPDVNGIPILPIDSLGEWQESPFTVALGDPVLRRRAAAQLREAGLAAITLVHPRVERSRWTEIGEGSVVCSGSIITTNVSIGAFVHVNLHCTISHDATLGDFVTLSPGVHVAGNVSIQSGAFVGTGATIINGSQAEPLTIGAGAVVAAGACVTKSVEPGAMVAGVPATRKR